MAVSWVLNLRKVLEPHLRGFTLGSRLLSTVVVEPLRSVPSKSSHPPVEVTQAANADRDGKRKVVGQELAMMRREYEKQMSELRKKYAGEEERKRKEKRQVEQITRERIMVEKEQRLVLRKERSKIRGLEVEEEMKVLRARLEEERKARSARRQWREKKLLHMRAREKEAIRQQSSMWIEEKDLERRIVDSLVDPFYLSGSYALPDRDGPAVMGDDDDDDDE